MQADRHRRVHRRTAVLCTHKQRRKDTHGRHRNLHLSLCLQVDLGLLESISPTMTRVRTRAYMGPASSSLTKYVILVDTTLPSARMFGALACAELVYILRLQLFSPLIIRLCGNLFLSTCNVTGKSKSSVHS